MKKPVVDYRELRLSNINEPRFKHVKLLLGWVGYFILYFLTENRNWAVRLSGLYISKKQTTAVTNGCQWITNMHLSTPRIVVVLNAAMIY